MARKLKIVFLFLISATSLVTATNSTIDELHTFNLTYTGGFNRKACYARTLELLENGTLDRDNEVFFRDNTGRIMSQDDDITLTLPGCYTLCGSRRDWYWDIGPRITQWLIPILLLISNVELSPLDKRRFFAIIHLIGDPIHSIWSLVHKIDAWDQCYRLAENPARMSNRSQRVVATIFAGFEEIRGPDLDPEFFKEIVDNGGLNDNDEVRYCHWRMAAVELADSRSDEILRTTLAILLYGYHIIASFVEEVGGDQSSLPGGRIGTAMFISWLVPVVLLSNSIGGFTSRRSASSILVRFARNIGLPLDFHMRYSSWPGRKYPLATKYPDSLGWTGAIYTFRTWNANYVPGNAQGWRTTAILGISVAPICIGMIGAFAIIWYTLPVGFTCRHFWVIFVFSLYFISAFVTWYLHHSQIATGVYHWHIVLWKDGLIGFTSLLTIFLSSSGLFNSCFCFSGYFHQFGRAHVYLNSDPFYERKNDTVYPVVVAVCLASELAVFAIIAGIWWNGLQVMRWSEKARAAEWETAGGAIRSRPGPWPSTQSIPLHRTAQGINDDGRGRHHHIPNVGISP